MEKREGGDSGTERWDEPTTNLRYNAVIQLPQVSERRGSNDEAPS
jgi:hypothetical protein